MYCGDMMTRSETDADTAHQALATQPIGMRLDRYDAADDLYVYVPVSTDATVTVTVLK